MSHDQEQRRRSATTQAGIAIAVLLLALGVAGYFALRDTGRAAGSLAEKAREIFQPEPEAALPGGEEYAAPPDAATTAATAAEAAQAAADAIAAAAGTAEPATIQDAVTACVPTLLSLAQDVRIVAVDASATNVDFVQESADTPGRFVRLACERDRGTWNYVDAGRMVVPPMVGDPRALPIPVIDAGMLTPESYDARIQAAVAAAREPGMLEVRRVELSYVEAHGLLTRVRMQRGAGALDVVLDAGLRTLPETTPFPQVERMAGVSEEEARLGFRDLGQTLWTTGVAASVDTLRDDYFNQGEKLHALELVGRQVTAYVAAGGGDSMVVDVDAYGDRAEREKQVFQPGQCGRPFSMRDARTALDAAMRARRETLEQFEAREFDTAILDCAENPGRAQWRFGGG